MKTVFRWALVVVWMGVIFWGSSIPANRLPKGPELAPVLAHYFEYLILCILLIWAINERLRGKIFPLAIFTALGTTIFYAITDELHQIFVPGRVPDILDLMVDAAGALTAIALVYLFNALLPIQAKKQ